MSESADKDSKTEEPTEKKIRDAVEKGNLPHSRETAIVASFGAVLVFTLFFLGQSVTDLSLFLGRFLESPEEWPLESERDLETLLGIIAAECGRTVGLLFLFLIIAGIGATLVQHSPQMVGERIRPQWSRVSPAAGWKRLFGTQGFVEFAKSVAKVGLAFVVVYLSLDGVVTQLLSGSISPADAFGHTMLGIATRVLIALTLTTGLIAAADFVWTRYHWKSELRMTKQEIKDEFKQSEGDPIVKGRIRSMQRDRARRRMIASVPKATLVIANPTHFSIALRYVREENDAPVVVAKGQDLLALKIREIAAQNGIPVFEEVALARSMYKQVSVDSVIPPQFYQAVAELVRIVYAKKGSGGGGHA